MGGWTVIDLTIELKKESDFDPVELEMWFEGGFLRQILDIYPEVYRLRKYEADEDALVSQWNTLIELVSMTMLDKDVEEATKYELLHNIEKLRDYYTGANVTEATAFGWWKQWRDDVNRTVAHQAV